jgi:hypothetical protein
MIVAFKTAALEGYSLEFKFGTFRFIYDVYYYNNYYY